MRRLAAFALFALLGTSTAPLLSPGPQDCCPMGGDMSCCPNRISSDNGCGLRQCAPDGDGGVVLPLAKAVLVAVPAAAPLTSSRPLPALSFVSPDSMTSGPQVPPPRA